MKIARFVRMALSLFLFFIGDIVYMFFSVLNAPSLFWGFYRELTFLAVEVDKYGDVWEYLKKKMREKIK